MLPRQHRLPLRKERDRVEQTGSVHSSPFLTLYSSQRKDSSLPTRIAVIVSKKLFPKAVDRNLFRRRILHQLRLVIPQLQSGHDLLIIPRKRLTLIKPTELKKTLIQDLSSLR